MEDPQLAPFPNPHLSFPPLPSSQASEPSPSSHPTLPKPSFSSDLPPILPFPAPSPPLPAPSSSYAAAPSKLVSVQAGPAPVLPSSGLPPSPPAHQAPSAPAPTPAVSPPPVQAPPPFSAASDPAGSASDPVGLLQSSIPVAVLLCAGAPEPSPAATPPPVPAAISSAPQPPAAPAAPQAIPLSAHPSDPQSRVQPVRRNAQATPLPPLSYAQATIGAPGSGFVRAHARDVDSFARLPRTGINVICGTREGIPAFSFVHSELPIVEGLYAKALVMKFLRGRPSLAASHKEISCWGLESPFSIGPLTSRSFLLRFQDERDLLKILTRPSSTLVTFPYKIFRWHSRCHKNEDSVMVPVWISLPRLPLQCFAPEFLESIANRIGRFLCFDKATATLARPSTARMCIELDLRKARPQCIWIGLFEGFKQPILYERLPKFCMGCHMQGHSSAECSKPPLDTPQPLDSGRNPAVQHRPQVVRQNAKESSSADAQGLPSQSASVHLPPGVAPSSAAVQPQAAAASLQLSQPGQPSSPAVDQPPPQSALPLSSSAPSYPPSPVRQSVPESAPPLSSTSPSPAIPHPSSPQSQPNAIQPQPPDPPPPVSAPPLPLSPPASLAMQSSQPQAPGQPPQPPSVPSSNQNSPSPHQALPPIMLMPRQHPRSGRSKAAAVPTAAASPRFQPSPPPSSGHPKHHKSVTFMPQQSNIQANQALWDVVNRHIAQFNQARLSPVEDAPSSARDYEEPPDPSSFSPIESDSGASIHEDENPQSYVSEGEELNVEPITLQGHISDDAFYQRPKSSKRNKRHPDGPLKVKLRARKGSSSIHR